MGYEIIPLYLGSVSHPLYSPIYRNQPVFFLFVAQLAFVGEGVPTVDASEILLIHIRW